MQDFVNRAGLERVAAAIYAGPHARHALYGLIFCVVTLAAGVTLALIWLSLALLVEAARTALLSHLPRTDADRVVFALDLVSAATLATAPAMLWFSHAAASDAAAIGLLCALLIDRALNSKTGRVHTLLACSPYATLGFAMALESSEAFWGVVACGCAIAYVFGAAIHSANRNKIARQQDAELVRQSNMHRDPASPACWEIDYEQRAISGAEALSTLLGRPATYKAVAEGACFAIESDRALVRAAFAPGRRPAQRIAIEHDAVREDGSSVRIRHEGFLHTAPDGAARRLSCTSTLAALTQVRGVEIGEVQASAPIVLLIDHEPDGGALTAPALARAGFSVLIAAGGEAGFAAARAQAPALILLDMAPSHDCGWRMLQSLKRDPRTHDIPVVALTASQERARALSLGAAEQMTKPVNRGALAATVMRYARNRTAAAPQAGSATIRADIKAAS